MHGITELILNSALLWIFLQTIWIALVSAVYYFEIPWIVWGSLIIAIGWKLARVPPPQSSIVQEVLGVDPLLLKKEISSSEDNGSGEPYCMRVVAHRGGGFDFPENSLAAFRNTKDKGCSAVELDLMLTKDNIPILFHDYTVDRLTGQPGTVREMTWDQLQDLDISHNHPLRHKFMKGEKIALFYTALQECLNNEQRIIIDIKETKLEVVQVVLDAFKTYPKLYKRGIISSFYPTVIYMIRRKDPRIVASLAWRPYYYSRITYSGLDGIGPVRYTNPFKHLACCIMDSMYDWAFSRFMYYIVGVSAVLLHKDIVNPQVIRQWHDRGVRVMAWSVNLPSEKSHFSRLLRVTYLTDTFVADKIM